MWSIVGPENAANEFGALGVKGLLPWDVRGHEVHRLQVEGEGKGRVRFELMLGEAPSSCHHGWRCGRERNSAHGKAPEEGDVGMYEGWLRRGLKVDLLGTFHDGRVHHSLLPTLA